MQTIEFLLLGGTRNFSRFHVLTCMSQLIWCVQQAKIIAIISLSFRILIDRYRLNWIYLIDIRDSFYKFFSPFEYSLYVRTIDKIPFTVCFLFLFFLHHLQFCLFACVYVWCFKCACITKRFEISMKFENEHDARSVTIFAYLPAGKIWAFPISELVSTERRRQRNDSIRMNNEQPEKATPKPNQCGRFCWFCFSWNDGFA